MRDYARGAVTRAPYAVCGATRDAGITLSPRSGYATPCHDAARVYVVSAVRRLRAALTDYAKRAMLHTRHAIMLSAMRA